MFIYYKLEVGFCGCEDEGVIEVEDGTSDRDLDELVHEMAMEWATNWEGDERLYDEWDEDTVETFYENVYGNWRPATEDEIEDYS